MGILTSTVSAGSFVGTASYSVQTEFLNGTQSFAFVATNQIYELVPTQSFISKEDEGDQFISGSLTVAHDLHVLGQISASKLIIQYITSSQILVTGSTVWGDELIDTHQFTGSVTITGSLQVNGHIIGPVPETASYALQALSASYSNISTQANSATVAISSSHALFANASTTAQTATSSSYALQATSASYVDITGSGVTVNYFGSQIQLTASVAEAGLTCYPTYTQYALGNPSYPTIGTYAGTTYNVATQTEFTTALTSAAAGDIINLTADIDLASTLTINKSVKVKGNGFAIQTPNTSNTIATAVSVTAANVYFDSTVVVKQRKTNNTSVDVAVAVNALNFVSEATVEFMEFGYVLRGTNVSFNISGTTKYTGALGNNHRHIAIHTMTANSIIGNHVFDFPQETTARASSIALLYSTAGDVKTATLKVANTTQTATYGRQFFLVESLTGITAGGNFALIFDNNTWNDVNGGIGILSVAPQSPLNHLKFLQLTNNTQGTGYLLSSGYKGLVFLDASGAITPIGNTQLYYKDNQHPTALRVDYTSAIDNGGIAFENTTLTNLLPLTIVTDCEIVNNALEYVSSVPTGSNSNVSASYALFAETASYVALAQASLTATSSSFATTSTNAVNAVSAVTASYVSGSISNIGDSYSQPPIMMIVTLTQAEYDAIEVKNANTLYAIV